MAVTGLSGCVYDSYPDEPERNDGEVYLTLNIGSADSFGTVTHTRADGTYFFEEPERQNEKLNNISVFVIREDGTIEDSRRISVNSEFNSTSMTFVLSEGKKKVYLFGNYTALPDEFMSLIKSLSRNDVFPAEELAALVLSRQSGVGFYTTNQLIPMCESFDVTLDVENAGTRYFNADVFVTRIAVKYTFICLDNVDALSVSLNGMATRQFLMPADVTYLPEKYEAPEVINGISGRNITEFSTPSDPGISTFVTKLSGKTEITVTRPDGKEITAYRYNPVYLMESPGEEFSMSVCFDQEVTGVPAGKWYEDQTLPNLPLLPRNTHVVVYLSADKNILDCKVDVVPYRGCVLEPFFGLERK